MLLATLMFTSLFLSPQGGQEDKALLTPAEQKQMQQKLARLIAARTTYDEGGSDRQREKAQKEYDKAREAFTSDWEAREKKGINLLASMPDLTAIFANCLPYERKQGMTLRKVDAKENIPAYYLAVPKDYKPEVALRTLLVVPGADEKGDWVDPKRWMDETWGDKADAYNDTIFHAVVMPKEIDLDPVPDYSRADGEDLERRRNASLMLSFGETQRQYNVDRSRLVIDAGKGACAYAIRAATHFPDRFAGVVLRHPTEVEDIRLGSITGMPVLLLESPDTAAVCKQIKSRLDALDPMMCTVITPTDAYPFKAAAPDIEKWLATVRRVVNRKKVVLEPNDDRFRKAYWVAIEVMDSVHNSPPDKKPRVEAEVDRAANRINIKAVGVESLTLQLNDALIDLDKDFTIVVNDKAIVDKRRRDQSRMLESMLLRFDTEFLFPVQFKVQVPKAD